jgi:tripartite-type tricarboxylate transporter receptor subunit TctC
MAVADTDSYAQKKEFPERAIKIIIQTTPGGVTDLWARAWSNDLSKLLMVPVMIQNEGGSSAMADSGDCLPSIPDHF